MLPSCHSRIGIQWHVRVLPLGSRVVCHGSHDLEEYRDIGTRRSNSTTQHHVARNAGCLLLSMKLRVGSSSVPLLYAASTVSMARLLCSLAYFRSTVCTLLHNKMIFPYSKDQLLLLRKRKRPLATVLELSQCRVTIERRAMR